MKLANLAAVVIAFTLVAPTALAVDRLVPSQYATIQAAIDAAVAGDVIMVSPGTYQGQIDFKGKGIVVQGAGAATTTLSGSPSVRSVVLMKTSEPATARLDGFKITGGVGGTALPGFPSVFAGGGLLAVGSSAKIANCVFTLNDAGFGGGAYLLTCGGRIENCSFISNNAESDGGGIQFFDCTTAVVGCRNANNDTTTRGGGMHIVKGNPTITDSSIRNNHSWDRGGGISWDAAGSVTASCVITSSNIYGNVAQSSGGGVYSYPMLATGQPTGAFLLVDSTVCWNEPESVYGPHANSGTTAVCSCLGDVVTDGMVDGIDLAAILGSWGGPAQWPHNADVNLDGIVDGYDLALVLGSWGTCSDDLPPLSWATTLEAMPNPAVVTNNALLEAIIGTGKPWRVRDNASNIEMLLVPPGVFMMGASPGDGEASGNEFPAHQVTLTNAFYMGKTEVTQAQWLAEMGSNPSMFQAANGFLGSMDRPVEQVSWTTIQQFLTQNGLRLPTEAEWEYACRAGTTTARYGVFNDIAWNGGNNNPYGTKPVATKLPNALGLCDTIGNVAEWAKDLYGAYSAAAVTNPTGPASGVNRLLRGGTWANSSYFCRASSRYSTNPGSVYTDVGFRVARTP